MRANLDAPSAPSSYLEIFPGKEIAPGVERLWISRTPAGRGAVLREVIPDGNVDLVICLTPESCSLHLFGPATKPLVAAAPKGSMLAGMRFHPGLAPRLADVSHPELLDACIKLDKVLGLSAAELGHGLASMVEAKAGPGQCLDFLAGRLNRVNPGPMASALCRRAAELALATQGDLRIADWARELGTSVRGLERRFNRELGISPKSFLRLIRLQRAVEGLRAARLDHAALAAHCGFADQAHMIHEFRNLSGRTPGSLARRLRLQTLLAEPLPGAPLHVMS